MSEISSVFFFQAEDGIRDVAVTGVQTCALPIYACRQGQQRRSRQSHVRERLLRVLLAHPSLAAAPDLFAGDRVQPIPRGRQDRKSTRLNSSHGYISYAVFCLKKKQ